MSTDYSNKIKDISQNLNMCEFVAIDMDIPDPSSERALDWMEGPKVVMRPNSELVGPNPAIASPTELAAFAPPQVIVDEEKRMVDLEPRKFKEKKEKYGRDAKKLYETYQEEWDRLVRRVNVVNSGTILIFRNDFLIDDLVPGANRYEIEMKTSKEGKYIYKNIFRNVKAYSKHLEESENTLMKT
jgi:hypothetical protein